MFQQRNTIIKRRKSKRMNALKKITNIQEKAEKINSLEEEISENSSSSDEGEKVSVVNINDNKRKFSRRGSQLKVTLIEDNKKKPGTFLLDENSEVFNFFNFFSDYLKEILIFYLFVKKIYDESKSISFAPRKSTLVLSPKSLVVEKDFNLFLYDFENGSNFIYYFPENNMEKVISQIKTSEIPSSPIKKLLKKRKVTTQKIEVAKEN